MIRISGKEPSLGLAMDAVGGGVEGENQGRRGRVVGGEVLIEQDLSDAEARLAVDAVFQAAKGGWRGQSRLLVGDFVSGELQGGIPAEGEVVIEIFVSQGDCDDALGKQSLLVMDQQMGLARIGDGVVECVEQSDMVSEFAEQ